MTSVDQLDPLVREYCDRSDYKAAATTILNALGGHVVRVIHARFRDQQITAEVFSAFTEDMWSGLLRFRFECSVRAWVFLVARNAGNRYLRRDLQRQRINVPLSAVPELAEQAARIRSATLTSLNEPREQRLARLRSELSPDDQELLTLRVDRELDFVEIALVTLGDPAAEAGQLTREAARLRKRFQLLKERLRKRWRETGAAES